MRWKAPVDPAPWTTPLATKTFASACVQYQTVNGPGANNAYDETIASSMNQVVGSEDCLYLNLWRPATDEHNLPVIVFIHGGYNLTGYTADPVYNGANLARVANAVVVSIAYRLGVFGWISLPQLKTGIAADDSGNFGTLDQIKALRWVHENVGEFGGDAGNVTVMGQSAGATNAWALMTAPQVRDAALLHKVIPISGGLSLPNNLPPGAIPFLYPTAYYARQGMALLTRLLIRDGKAKDDAAASAYLASQDKTRSRSTFAIRRHRPSWRWCLRSWLPWALACLDLFQKAA